MNAPFLDEWLSAIIIQIGLSKGFSWDSDNVLLPVVVQPELRLDGVFPFAWLKLHGSFRVFLHLRRNETAPLARGLAKRSCA
jgi:hypothetical protein